MEGEVIFAGPAKVIALPAPASNLSSPEEEIVVEPTKPVERMSIP